jgi:hypothetical protein
VFVKSKKGCPVLKVPCGRITAKNSEGVVRIIIGKAKVEGVLEREKNAIVKCGCSHCGCEQAELMVADVKSSV